MVFLENHDLGRFPLRFQIEFLVKPESPESQKCLFRVTSQNQHLMRCEISLKPRIRERSISSVKQVFPAVNSAPFWSKG